MEGAQTGSGLRKGRGRKALEEQKGSGRRNGVIEIEGGGKCAPRRALEDMLTKRVGERFSHNATEAPEPILCCVLKYPRRFLQLLQTKHRKHVTHHALFDSDGRN